MQEETNESDDDVPEEFEENLYKATSHTEYSVEQMCSIQKVKDNLQRLVVNEFLNEATSAAIQLRNVLGDADGHAAELAQTIADNITVVVREIVADPGEFALSILRAQQDKISQQLIAQDIMVKIKLFIESASETNNNEGGIDD